MDSKISNTDHKNLSVAEYDHSDDSLHYQLAFVGAGLSNTYTILHYLNKLVPRSNGKQPRLLIIEKSGDTFKGIAYGKRSGNHALTINCLAEFFPSGELEPFHRWISDTIRSPSDEYRTHDEFLCKTWLRKHADEIINRDISNLYIPRFIFGLYISEKVRASLADAEENSLITYQIIQAQVYDISNTDGVFTLHTLTAEKKNKTVTADKVVLGLGSPPKRNLLRQPEGNNTVGVVINDPFNPGMGYTMSQISNGLSRTEPHQNNIVIVGSNATASDVIYNLLNHTYAHEIPINRITVVSPSGQLPERYSEADIGQVQYKAINLLSLKGKSELTAQQIYEAAATDIREARLHNITIAMSLATISHAVSDMLEHLSHAERTKFVSDTGNAIGKLQRRTGNDYSDLFEDLLKQGTLVLRKGRYCDYEVDDSRGISVNFSALDLADTTYTLHRVRSIVNCSGSGLLANNSPDDLIRQLILRKLCRVNESGIGFHVDSNLQACRQNLFVIGPMMAGNIINGQPVWHAEHCGRIFKWSNKLASRLHALETEELLQTTSAE